MARKKTKTGGAKRTRKTDGAGKTRARKARVRDLSTRKGDLAGGGQLGQFGQFGQVGGIVKKTL